MKDEGNKEMGRKLMKKKKKINLYIYRFQRKIYAYLPWKGFNFLSDECLITSKKSNLKFKKQICTRIRENIYKKKKGRDGGKEEFLHMEVIKEE